MGRFVIVAYRPKHGKEEDLLVAVRKHVRVLKDENLVTDRPAYVLRAGDGTLVEVFEWRSAEAVHQDTPTRPSRPSGGSSARPATTCH